jgi:hypothetical protein
LDEEKVARQTAEQSL